MGNIDRIEVLTGLINEKYMQLHPNEVDARCEEYECAFTEMLEVTNISPKSVVLMELYGEAEYEPVFVPPEILRQLKKRDVFLMTIAGGRKGWEIIWMSPPYEEHDWTQFDMSEAQ